MKNLSLINTKTLVTAAVLTGAVSLSAKGENRIPERMENPTSVMEVALNVAVKQVCSDYFISKLPLDKIVERSVMGGEWIEQYRYVPNEYYPYSMALFKEALEGMDVDENKKMVQISSGPYVAKARYYGDQGCAMLNPYTENAYFKPQKIERKVADDGLFPENGSLLSSAAELPKEYNADKLRAAVTEALDPEHHGAALLVMHKGQLVLEEYAEGVTKDTPMLNWSMGKSILGTLIGRLEQKELIKLDQPAPINVWHAFKEDPRGKIKIMDLLRMSSGLECSRNDPIWLNRGLLPEHSYIYMAPVDILQYNIYSAVRENGPNEKWRYSNCDMQALGFVLKKMITTVGEDYLSWPYEELYNKIGMSGMVSEVDTYGNFHLTGYDYGTARDWARYGLLYLNDGVWDGERLLSKEFVKAAQTLAPVFTNGKDEWRMKSKSTYGATHWLNARNQFSLPTDAFMARGYSGNFAIMSTSEDLVVVLLRFTGNTGDRADANAVFKPLMAGLGIEVVSSEEESN